MSQLILLKVQNYLAQLKNGKGTKVDFPTINAFASKATSILLKALSPDSQRDFRLRMSILGRPGCQLQAEKAKLPREAEPYSSRFRNMYGDLIEAAAVLTMRQAGVNIKAEQGRVSLKIGDADIDGTFDLIIAEPDDKLYDVKSASSYAYKNKFLDKTLYDLYKEDDFGYVVQLYLYSQALGIPVGGLIIVNKETGEWCIVEPPLDDVELRKSALQKAHSNILRMDQPFSKDFSEVEEKFKKKPTGNRMLSKSCGWCAYRGTCWPEAKFLKQPSSEGQNPRKYWYTFIDERFNDGNKEENTNN